MKLAETFITLDDIGLTTKSDKSSAFHDYLRTYEQLFDLVRYEPVSLLEIGVLGGDSLKIWDEFFTHPATRIVGVDIVAWPRNHAFTDRVRIINGDGGDPEFLYSLPHPFDICIDDGPHLASQQMRSFAALFPLMSHGGLYCIEDTHSAYAPELCDAQLSILQFLVTIVAQMQGMGAKASGKVEPDHQWASIDTISFRRGLAVIRKAK